MRRGISFLRRVARRLARPPKRAYASARRTFGRLVRAAKRAYPGSLRLLSFNIACADLARTLAPDVVEAHDLNTLAGGVIVKRIRGCPLVYDSHELFLERNLGNRSRAYDKLVWAPVERFCIRRCDAVLSVAEGICLHLARQYRIPKPHLIRNVQPWEPPAPRSTLLADELGIPHGTPIVLYPGAITINRGLEVMIDSALHLEDAVYVIMGYGVERYVQSLRERAENLGVLGTRVFFREAVPIEDVIRYVASADLGIVPTQNICLSYYFESSNKIFHCVMAGVPLVMSDHAEKRMIMETHGIGTLFDETNPRDIAEVVTTTLADREAYDVCVECCLRASRTLNWEHEEHALRSVFAALLGERVPPVPPIRFSAEAPEPAEAVAVPVVTTKPPASPALGR